MIVGGVPLLLKTKGVPADYLAFYPMDSGGVSGSTLFDEGPNGYDGTINGATQTSDYLSFDGTNDNVNAITKFLSGLTEFSMSFDVWFDTTASADYDIVTCGAHIGGDPFFFWYDTAATDHYAFFITDSGGTTTGSLTSSAVPATGSWETVVFTFDGGNEARMHINGSEDANSPWSMAGISDIGTTVGASSNNSIAFGYQNLTSSSAKYLDGRLRKMRFYSRVLSDSEISSIFSE